MIKDINILIGQPDLTSELIGLKRYKQGGRRLQPDYRQKKIRPNMPNKSNLVQIR